MDSQLGFAIGHSARETVRVSVAGRAHIGAVDYWDGNWLLTPVSGVLGGFKFEIPNAQLRADEIRDFAQQLRILYANLTGEAHLRPIEPWIEIVVSGNGSGRLKVDGRVCDELSFGNRLDFSITDYDQTYLPSLLDNLDLIGTTFPVQGEVAAGPAV